MVRGGIFQAGWLLAGTLWFSLLPALEARAGEPPSPASPPTQPSTTESDPGSVESVASPPRFLTEVMAVLSKAGCNMGACHGNLNGKGGFKLSLRGEDPWFDYDQLVRQHGGRRIDRLAPEQSLLLRKPTLRTAHEGGRRFAVESLEYRVLRDWLAAGAPPPDAETPRLVDLRVTPADRVLLEPDWEVPLRAVAHFSDGTVRDVTRLAVYESSSLLAEADVAGRVRGKGEGEVTVAVRYLDQQRPVRLAFMAARPDFRWSDPRPNNRIDTLVFERLRQLRRNPSPLADDSTFVRRAYLDALGIPPTSDEARRFVADPRPDKRRQLIDRLLTRPELADHWALKWSDVLRNEEKVLDPRGVEVFHGWIRENMVEGLPLDQFVRQLLVGSGSTYEHPPANFYRANRDPATRGETVARLFLGIRLQCAKCHNHPFDRWTQDDYYSWAALFSRIDYKIIENNRADKLDKNEFNGEQIVLLTDQGEVRNPRTGQDARPRFLGAGDGRLEAGVLEAGGPEAGQSRLAALAGWLASRDNRQFARAQANRIWYHLTGRGLVEPIDDFRVTNPPSHPELLDYLAEELRASGFDLRHLLRLIMNSRVYQVAAEPNGTNAGDQDHFARAIVRRLPAESLLDAQCRVLDAPAEFAGYPRGLRAGQIPGVRKVRRRSQKPADDDRFLTTFGKPERLLACDCERSDETTLNQAFVLLGGQGLQRRLTLPGNRLQRLAESPAEDREIVSELYWSALSRPPSDQELEMACQLLDDSSSRWEGLQDLAWALLNSKEFVFRH